MCVCVCGFASKFHRTMDTSNKMTGHNFRPRLYIPAMPARSEQEKGFVGTSSDGGRREGGGSVTLQKRGSLPFLELEPNRLTKLKWIRIKY